jgi:EAL domain-containing protein (putative c-di-GMP-specific phosphodiesterase class I)
MNDIEARFRTAGRFTDALKRGDFSLFCQQIVPIASTKVNYKYLEIYVRFKEEEDKLLPPGTFFPVLEINHLTPLLDRWVVREVLRWTGEKRGVQANWHIPRFNINLADDTVRDKDFPVFVRDQLNAMKVPADRLSFEVTAQQFAQFPAATKQAITGLKVLGCPIAVSDFSENEAVAKAYRDAGVQIVKIAASVILDAHKNPLAASKLLALNGWCQKLGLKTVATFVENRETLAVLSKAGVDFAQGFGIAVPLPLSLMH